jgi:hypothetical protein
MKKTGSGAESGPGPNPDPELEPNPDPLVRGVDPRIRIGTKISWIRHTDLEPKKFLASFFATKNHAFTKIDDSCLCIITISGIRMAGILQEVLIVPDYSLVSGIACPGALPCASWSLFHTFQVNLARRPARCPLLKGLEWNSMEFKFFDKNEYSSSGSNIENVPIFVFLKCLSDDLQYCNCHFPRV